MRVPYVAHLESFNIGDGARFSAGWRWEGSGWRKKAVPGSLPSQAQSGTPCGFSRFDSDTPPRRKPRWGEGPRGFPHVKKKQKKSGVTG